MLEASDLMVFYENNLALNNVHIRCDQNQIVGVFGANSAGKSTLMHALSGIVLDMQKKEAMAGGERITVAGSVRYQGNEVMTVSPSRRAKMGIVLCPERRRIFKESTVLENLKIGGYLASPSQARETLAYVFDVFPALYRLKNRIGGFLSGGEQQMLAIGRALMAQPKILLLDEPLLRSWTYDAVILDIMGVRGYDLLNAAVHLGFPTVMLTAHALSADDLKRSITLGARAYIPKERMTDIPAFLEDVITLGHRSNLKKMFQRLGGLFNNRFGSQWMEDEKTFWDSVISGEYQPKPVILKK